MALSPRGRVTSVRCSDGILKVLGILDGSRQPVEVASALGLGENQVATLLDQLTGIGAVEWRPPGIAFS